MTSAYFELVTSNMFSGGHIGRTRSTVICSNERPIPKKSRNCLGILSREKGQKREPTPPHIITQ